MDDSESGASVSLLFVGSEAFIGRSWQAQIFVIPMFTRTRGPRRVSLTSFLAPYSRDKTRDIWS